MPEVPSSWAGWPSLAVFNGRLAQLLLLTLTIGAAVYARTALSPLQEMMRAALDLSDNQVALLQGPALAAPMLIAAIPLGMLVDRCSRARMLFLLSVLVLAGSASTALASSLAELMLARGLVGVAAFAMAPAALSLLADSFEPAQRGRATTVLTIGQFAGSGAAFAMGGFLASLPGETWQSAMGWLTAPVGLITAAALWMREPDRKDRVHETRSTSASFFNLWERRAQVLPPLVGIVLAEIYLQAIMIWTAPALSRRFVLDPAEVGALLGMIVPFAGILGAIAGGALGDVCHKQAGPRRTLAALAVLGALGAPAAFFGVAPNLAAATVLLSVAIGILNALLVMGLTLFAVVVPNELRGLCAAILTGLGVMFAIGLAPPLVSMLSGVIGGPETIGIALTAVCGVVSVLAGIAFASGRACISTP